MAKALQSSTSQSKTTTAAARRPAFVPKTRAPSAHRFAPTFHGEGQDVQSENPSLRPGRNGVVQARLKLGASNDPAEAEADAVADRVMRMPDANGNGTAEAVSETAVQPLRRQSDGGIRRTPWIQRACVGNCGAWVPDKEKEQEQSSTVRPKRDGGFAGGGTLGGSAAASIHAALDAGGSPLPVAERRFFEPRFGEDLSDVRIHTGAGATRAAESIQARAFAYGNNIVFNAGQYRPGSTEGRRLLAHEIAHTRQQGGPARRAPIIRRQEDGDTYEKYSDDKNTGTSNIAEKVTPECVKEAYRGRIRMNVSEDKGTIRVTLDMRPCELAVSTYKNYLFSQDQRIFRKILEESYSDQLDALPERFTAGEGGPLIESREQFLDYAEKHFDNLPIPNTQNISRYATLVLVRGPNNTFQGVPIQNGTCLIVDNSPTMWDSTEPNHLKFLIEQALAGLPGGATVRLMQFGSTCDGPLQSYSGSSPVELAEQLYPRLGLSNVQSSSAVPPSSDNCAGESVPLDASEQALAGSGTGRGCAARAIHDPGCSNVFIFTDLLRNAANRCLCDAVAGVENVTVYSLNSSGNSCEQ